MSCWTYNKTGMLFPLKLFTSFMWQQVVNLKPSQSEVNLPLILHIIFLHHLSLNLFDRFAR